MIKTSTLSTQKQSRAFINFFTSRIKMLIVGITVVIALTPLVAHGLTTIAESYTSKEKLSAGSIVSLKKDSSDQVEAASTNNVENILGVVINDNSSLLSVSNGSEDQVQVATSGTVRVFVSDINGQIKRGDHVTASPINGVGMKATGNVRIVGIAQGDAGTGKKETFKDSAGKEKTASLSEITILVNVAYFFKEPEKTIVPSAIQNIANTLAGKEVSTLPILVSVGVFLITLIIVVVIIYSMIHSSIISVGRNPMSQSAVYRDLIQMSGLILAILTVCVIVIYLVLTRL